MPKANSTGLKPVLTAALPRRKQGAGVGKTTRGKGTKGMVVDGQGMPLGHLLASASPAEVTLLEPTLDTMAVPRNGPGRPRQKPERVLDDQACDADPWRTRLAQRGIELIGPHRRKRVKPPLQEGRKLRRYQRRWKDERTFAWPVSYRRLAKDYEELPATSEASIYLAMSRLMVRRLAY